MPNYGLHESEMLRVHECSQVFTSVHEYYVFACCCRLRFLFSSMIDLMARRVGNTSGIYRVL